MPEGEGPDLEIAGGPDGAARGGIREGRVVDLEPETRLRSREDPVEVGAEGGGTE